MAHAARIPEDPLVITKTGTGSTLPDSFVSEMNIRAVIFDFGGVVASFPTPEQWAEAAEFSGIESSRLQELFWRNRAAYDAGHDATDYWRDIARRAGVTFSDAQIAGMIQREIAFWSRFDAR